MTSLSLTLVTLVTLYSLISPWRWLRHAAWSVRDVDYVIQPDQSLLVDTTMNWSDPHAPLQ